ncbi:uncharacterized protein N7511_004647 [Penicillium nucicola]|uniref:uncharacterized protein n=1 Tax=Penicillium nucicola TaxID=1850975 RepID=UPI0025451EB9|nr:uncharacterized protein N7511_004647 [Penicillium nucicola]KAJ5767031.1 hypothetical protein N7511_004647 [Penicillium nucicola]
MHHSIDLCEPITQSTSVSDGLEPGGKRIRFTPDTLSEKSQGTVTVCTGCGTSLDETSKHCGRCLWARYCSRYCQVADWKRHKLTCGNPNPENTYQEPTDNRASVTEHAKILAAVARRAAGQGKVEPALQTHVPKPLTQLKALKWLFNRSESDICKLIVDALRLRFWDDDDLNDMFVLRLMQTGIESIVKRDFFELSTKLARKARLLPKWWAQSNTDNLIRFGIADEPWEREGGGGWNVLIRCWTSWTAMVIL